ncbi:phosphotransferase enzyme family protein [Demequina sp. NBRC 110054]|uniref:phosphotransferase enzyme family protein n=1 Tax=Demequina sp. NBRC 110054 TaxID=1570343 RepID=UPI000A0738F9|nr:phosphotransferase [Demequina sp. NBRC 110054]
MTAADPSATMLATDFFADLDKGDPAPSWLTVSVGEAWDLALPIEMTLIGVSENASFLLRRDGVPFAVLRLNRPGYLAGSGAVLSETAWVRAIAEDTDVAVPAPLAGADGETVQTLVLEGGRESTGVLSPFVPGTMLEDRADQERWFGRIGTATAQLHEHARGWKRPAGFSRHDWALEHMIGADARWGRWRDQYLLERDRALLARAEAAALSVLGDGPARTPDTWGLIHADIRPSNVIVEGDAMTVIDFDDCGDSWFLYDFASALTWMDHLPTAAGMAQDWIAGYREVRPTFSAADAEVAVALDMVRCLTMLGWCTTHRADALPPTLADGVVPAALTVAERYLSSPTWLLD